MKRDFDMVYRTGKTVYIDLGSESVNAVETDEKLVLNYLGGGEGSE